MEDQNTNEACSPLLLELNRSRTVVPRDLGSLDFSPEEPNDIDGTLTSDPLVD